MDGSIYYNEAVRRHFEDPRHAGELGDSFDITLTADASESDKGARIVLAAGISNGTIAAAAFRAWGCPHLIAAVDLACEQMAGQPVRSLENFDLAHITQELCIPAEKAGRILLLEDALATLWARYDGA